MSSTTYKWFQDCDVEHILNSQTVVITCLTNNIPQAIALPRHLLDKHSTIFKAELNFHDVSDPTQKQQTIPVSLNSWYLRRGKGYSEKQSEIDILRDWNMLQIFCRWTVCGRVIGRPMMHPKDVPWGLDLDPLFLADIEIWIIEDTNKRAESKISAAKK